MFSSKYPRPYRIEYGLDEEQQRHFERGQMPNSRCEKYVRDCDLTDAQVHDRCPLPCRRRGKWPCERHGGDRREKVSQDCRRYSNACTEALSLDVSQGDQRERPCDAARDGKCVPECRIRRGVGRDGSSGKAAKHPERYNDQVDEISPLEVLAQQQRAKEQEIQRRRRL